MRGFSICRFSPDDPYRPRPVFVAVELFRRLAGRGELLGADAGGDDGTETLFFLPEPPPFSCRGAEANKNDSPMATGV